MKIYDLKAEKEKLNKELDELFSILKKETINIPTNINDKISLLFELRKKTYENINQLQHKALIIKAIEILKKDYTDIEEWHWHPKQTSSQKEADITGYKNKIILLNAEATTSFLPTGKIDSIMKKTLLSLSKKEGDKFYFVKSKEMYNRAIHKSKNLGLDDIKIVNTHNKG